MTTSVVKKKKEPTASDSQDGLPSDVKVTERAITDYMPDTHNANKGSERGQAMIESSIGEVGPGRSLVADKNDRLPAGNKTQEAMVNLGITRVIEVETTGDVVIVHKRRDWDLEDPNGEARRYAYMDNRAGELSMNWDPEVLLQDKNDGFKLEDLFSDHELTDILNKLEGDKEPYYKPPPLTNDIVDEAQKKWNVEQGQVYVIPSKTNPGRFHRLMCGDSGKDMQRLMAGDKAVLLVTSPPYGVNKDYEENMTLDDWKGVIRSVFTACKDVCPTWFVNLGNKRTGNDGFELNTYGEMVNIFAELGVNMISMRIWAKQPNWLMAHPYWRHTYKPVEDFEFLGLFGQKPKYAQRLSDEEANEWGYRGVWNIHSVASNAKQSARFPIELPTRCMRLLSDFGDIILEPFCGSGQSIKAGEAIGRIVYGMELQPEDVAGTLNDFEEMGLMPERES